MRLTGIKRSAVVLSLALCLTTCAFPVTAAAAENEPAYTYKTYEGKSTKKVTVTDAYKKTYSKNEFGCKAKVRIPKVTIKGVNTTSINKTIYNNCKSNAGKYCSCNYAYYIGKSYISIRIVLQEEHDMSPSTDYKIYNISRKTGKQMSKAEMLKALNIKSSKFTARVKKAVIKYMDHNDMWLDYSRYPEMFNRNISSAKLKKCTPYVNSKGKLCFLYKSFEIPAGSGFCDHCGRC